jgi:C1A family cysteine protease
VDPTEGEYWVVRNTFGTNWGDYGFFYIKMHSDNLGIETDCIAGTPTFDKHVDITEII